MSLHSGDLERSGEQSRDFTESIGAEDFKSLAAHLLMEWQKQGKAPAEVRKFFV
ncbi:hypothetical protein [Streptomyces sp. NPDC058374]